MPALRVLTTLALLSGCVLDGEAGERSRVDATQTCESLGCPNSPSGAPDGVWTPCDEDVCYCRVSNTETLACLATGGHR